MMHSTDLVERICVGKATDGALRGFDGKDTDDVSRGLNGEATDGASRRPGGNTVDGASIILNGESTDVIALQPDGLQMEHRVDEVYNLHDKPKNLVHPAYPREDKFQVCPVSPLET